MITSKKHSSLQFSNILTHFILCCFCIFCIIPLLLVLSISFSNEKLVIQNGFQLIPQKIDLYAFKYIFSSSGGILNAYMVTIFVTVVGTISSLLITALFAYPLSRKELRYSNKIAFFAYFTMLFNGGLVPWYMLISRYLHLKDNIFVLIIPLLVSAWNVLLMRNFFKTIPDSIIDSAKIDGSTELKTFYRIVIPLSLPSLAAVGLFNTLMYWNDWWMAILFIEQSNLYPLQYMLQSVMTNIQALMSNTLMKNEVVNVPGETVRMALCVLAIGPIILAYPFFQRYFIKGLTIGAVKG